MVVASNKLLTEAFDDCEEAHIQKGIAFIDELRSEQARRTQHN